MAVAGFLAGYCGATRRSYASDLRLFSTWCHQANLRLFTARRAHLELFGRWMEKTGRMGGRMDRYAADGTVKRLARRAGIAKRISPHSLRHSFSPPPSTPGYPCETPKRQRATSSAGPPLATTLVGSPLIANATYIVATFLAGAWRQPLVDTGQE